jgi:hypothetical protein
MREPGGTRSARKSGTRSSTARPTRRETPEAELLAHETRAGPSLVREVIRPALARR